MTMPLQTKAIPLHFLAIHKEVRILKIMNQDGNAMHATDTKALYLSGLLILSLCACPMGFGKDIQTKHGQKSVFIHKQRT
ncbi:MAG: hypothetical protein VX737_01935 [Pseudomonadota bacterium]|nr:hypothetical protein [Pseudomonadota bacterium]